MLYVIHCANHPSLTYRGGQKPILHLEADLHAVIRWAKGSGVRWAFSSSNAGAYYAQFWAAIKDLNQIDWNAVANVDFRNPQVKEGKQAEFLIKGSFPWTLVEEIGVYSVKVEGKVKRAILKATHKPSVSVQQNWYY